MFAMEKLRKIFIFFCSSVDKCCVEYDAMSTGLSILKKQRNLTSPVAFQIQNDKKIFFIDYNNHSPPYPEPPE